MPVTPHDDASVTTSRRQADDREKLELALSAAKMGTFEWDLVADTITISEQAARIFGG